MRVPPAAWILATSSSAADTAADSGAEDLALAEAVPVAAPWLAAAAGLSGGRAIAASRRAEMASQELQQVYLPWHTDELEDGESDEKLLGVYSTEEKATRRIASAMERPGFREAPASFEVARYVVDHDQWAEGLVTS